MRPIAPSKKGYIMPEVKVRFPPEITPINLIVKAIAKLETSGQTSRIPNSFIAYRMAFYKELHSSKHPVITQPQLSTLVKQSWLKEEEHIRREYHRIAKEAKDLYIKICHERSPLFVTNMFSIDDEDYSSYNTKNNSDALEFVFSNSSILSDSNFDLFNSNEISLLPSTSSYETNTTASTTPNVTNIFNTDNLTPEQWISQCLFSSILSIQSDFPSVPKSSIISDINLSSAEYNKCCKEKIGVLENRVVELEKKLESLTKLFSDLI
ncbi:12442_t:CDS:2 [Ambispora gerdemannii]|uniref:12442_t:CDS:1 n=1 Tax=Ambispora gerdemannii TaxID=144530 RepID=A0A9N9AF25_9GLOM|nr:12442_t:CDS:2 [Ambispora gerdemannii]